MSWIVSGLWSMRIPHLLFELPYLSLSSPKKQERRRGKVRGCGGRVEGWCGCGVVVVCCRENFVNAKKAGGCVCVYES